ncbi:MAG TPA: NAD-dependent epimerase/dehydratase family protein [Flavobacteriales bacterium]|nr:NAD-dependent epimerase/dehydratase family protein [Flavobacteriales bacterium]
MAQTEKILVIGSRGQIGTELVEKLREMYGQANVFESDLKDPGPNDINYLQLNVLDKDAMYEAIKKHGITQVYLLAALLSATAEKNPAFGWELNMNSLFYILDMAKEKLLKKVYWPSSIAAFGPTTPKQNTPQHTIMDPATVYGISKQAGERWCEYYFHKYNVDVRSLRYPGLIGYKSLPGGGTTDYAVDIFYKAKQGVKFTSFLGEDTTLPMMYMDDAIRATVEIMEAPAANVKLRSSYNIAGMSFSPKEIAAEIKLQIPDFQIDYAPDFRQQIANGWPQSIDDSAARADWGWKNEYDLRKLVNIMLTNIKIGR